MKKMLIVLMAALVMASCSSPTFESVDSADLTASSRGLNSTVSLVKAGSFYRSHYGIPSVDRNFTIRVQNLSPTKTVVIHHGKTDGTWVDFAATYAGTAGTGYEIWTASYGWNATQPTTYDLSEKFVVKMTANGQTYWDNNGGLDYTLAQHGGELLGNGVNVIQSYANGYRGYSEAVNVSFYGGILVRNLAYTKKVNVVYTTDAWKTTKVALASFNSYWWPSYASPISSPNAYGTEIWTWSLEVPMLVNDNFEYVISYDVNGTTFWDNNYGKNYKKADIVR